MRHVRAAGSCLLAVATIVQTAWADEYDFEIGIAFDSSQFDGSQTTTTTGGTIFDSSSIDTDSLSVLGTWYFTGLSDDKGPRARAVLVDRASSLSIGYSRTEQSSSVVLTSSDPAFPLGPFDLSIDAEADTYSANFRYVDRASGWFGSAGLFTANATAGPFMSDSPFVGVSIDEDGWSLGAGKYLADTTTLSLNYSEVSDTSAVGLSFEHLGDLGASWQYAVDLEYSYVDLGGGFDLDTWGAAISLYPTRDFEFGLAVQDVSGDFPSADSQTIQGFASWYVKPNVRLSARYRVDDGDYSGTVFGGGGSTVGSSDEDSFGIGVSIRF